MFSSSWSVCRLAIVSLGLLNLVSYASAADIVYCSGLNTADTPKNSSIYQSNGLCYDFCLDTYAFAVVQYDGCWCSNFIPKTETTGCTRNCPGFPEEQCGGIGVYGYIQLVKKASGTAGAGKGTPSSTAKPSSTSPLPVTTDPPSSSSTWIPTPIISLETITGQVRTVTITPTVPPDAENIKETSSKKASGLGVGGAVGLALGLGALVALVGSIVFFCLRRRRQQREAELADTSRESVQGIGGPIPSRTMSENSRYVLGTDGRQVVETWENQNVPGSRTSRLMPVDPRLDPFSPVYQRGENISRESVNTIRDDHDYSRRVHGNGNILRATNPDE